MHTARAEANAEVRLKRVGLGGLAAGLNEDGSGVGLGDCHDAAADKSNRSESTSKAEESTEFAAKGSMSARHRRTGEDPHEAKAFDTDGFTDDSEASDSEDEVAGRRSERIDGDETAGNGNGGANAFSMLASVSLRSMTGSVFDRAHDIAVEVGLDSEQRSSTSGRELIAIHECIPASDSETLSS